MAPSYMWFLIYKVCHGGFSLKKDHPTKICSRFNIQESSISMEKCLILVNCHLGETPSNGIRFLWGTPISVAINYDTVNSDSSHTKRRRRNTLSEPMNGMVITTLNIVNSGDWNKVLLKILTLENLQPRQWHLRKSPKHNLREIYRLINFVSLLCLSDEAGRKQSYNMFHI
jgi:hypothetical protein